MLPEKSCSCNTLATLDVGEIDLHVAAAVLNSFAFDFLTRLRTAGTYLNWTYVSRVAVPSAMECSSLPSIETLLADCADAPERDERYFIGSGRPTGRSPKPKASARPISNTFSHASRYSRVSVRDFTPFYLPASKNGPALEVARQARQGTHITYK